MSPLGALDLSGGHILLKQGRKNYPSNVSVTPRCVLFMGTGSGSSSPACQISEHPALCPGKPNLHLVLKMLSRTRVKESAPGAAGPLADFVLLFRIRGHGTYTGALEPAIK